VGYAGAMELSPAPDLHAEGVAALLRYLRAPAEERTRHLRDYASVLVRARGDMFQRPDGTPDWRGQTGAYRQWVSDLYDAAGIPRDQRNSLRAAAGWHVSEILRDELDAETLREYGLQPRPLSEAGKEARKKDRAALRALTARDLHGGSLMAITAAYTVLSKVDGRDLTNLDERAAEVARATLEDLEATARRLHKRVTTRAEGAGPVFRAPEV
jgi:hypothetical protein